MMRTAEGIVEVSEQAAADKKYRRRWLTLSVLSMALLLIALDVTVLNVAIPTLQRDLNASAGSLQWIINSYILVFAGLLLTAGSLGDRFGRKRALQSGLVIFGLASIAAAFSETSGQLIAARAAQGIGGAFIMPSTLSVIVDVFPRAERAKAIGIWAGMSGLGIPVGMIAGGWLVGEFSWGAVFLINAPVAIAVLVGGQLLVPESRDPAARRIDFGGALISMATLTALVYTLIEAPGRGWLDPLTLLGFAATLAGGAAFVTYEAKASEPMVDLRFFRNPRLSAGMVAVAVTFMGMLGMMFILTQYLQFARGYTPLETGVRFTPMALGFMLGAPSSAILVKKLGTKKLMGTGLMIFAAVMVGMSFFEADTPYVLVGLALLALGVGAAYAMAPATDAVMAALPEEQAGIGSALNDTARQVGGALGVGVFGSVFNSVYGSSIAGAIGGLPREAAAAAENSIGAAIQVATGVGGGAGEALQGAAINAFVDGLGVVFVATAVVAFLGGLFVFRYMPAQDVTPEELFERRSEATSRGTGQLAPILIPVED